MLFSTAFNSGEILIMYTLRTRLFVLTVLQQRRQQRELMKALQQQQQQQQQQQKLSGWGNVTKPAGTTKSLLEIQQEEARQMQKQQQQHQHQQQQSRSRTTTVSTLLSFQFLKKLTPDEVSV